MYFNSLNGSCNVGEVFSAAPSFLLIRTERIICFIASQLILAICVYLSSAHAKWEHPSFEILQSKYESLLQSVSAGDIPKDVGGKARTLWISVRKDLVTINANIETLKLEVMEKSGARQEQAIDQLIEKSEERAHILFRAVQNMDRLLKEQGYELQETYLIPPAAKSVDNTENRSVKTESSKERELDIRLELAPEDLSKGEME